MYLNGNRYGGLIGRDGVELFLSARESCSNSSSSSSNRDLDISARWGII